MTTIPYPRPVPVRHDVDVFVAGRCVSTDRHIQGSLFGKAV
ncbi:MAG: hypothetical protein WC789_14180 [Lentisphaeria bacterium]